MPSPTQGTVIASIDVELYLSSKSNAQALAGGKLYFWQDTNRINPMPVYTQVLGSGPPTYTYIELPNPITLSASGCPLDAMGNNVVIYYWPYNPVTGAIQQYYITCYDSGGATGLMQFTREAWPPLWAISSGSISTVINTINTGRLTLTSGVPVTTQDVTGADAVTIFYTPYKGNGILLYTMGSWEPYTYSEISIAVPASMNQMYDVFATPVGPNVVLQLAAWTNDTTRATALTLLNGVYVSSANNSYRYLGSFITTGTSGQTEDSVANRFLWNYYNRVSRAMIATTTSTGWDYSTAVWRQANADTTNQLNFVCGVVEDSISAKVHALATNTMTSVCGTGVGVNSTSLNSATLWGTHTFSTIYLAVDSSYDGIGYGAGYNFLAWLEATDGVGTTTWHGATFSFTGGGSDQTGITGTLLM